MSRVQILYEAVAFPYVLIHLGKASIHLFFPCERSTATCSRERETDFKPAELRIKLTLCHVPFVTKGLDGYKLKGDPA